MLSAKRVYETIKEYTDDKIALALAKSWINKNKYYSKISSFLGINIKRKFDLDIEEVPSEYRKEGTDLIIQITAGLFFFTKSFTIQVQT